MKKQFLTLTDQKKESIYEKIERLKNEINEIDQDPNLSERTKKLRINNLKDEFQRTRMELTMNKFR